ncbi:hypothetical protein ACA910_016107 [Epithemia clementina (nom. ined.)]
MPLSNRPCDSFKREMEPGIKTMPPWIMQYMNDYGRQPSCVGTTPRSTATSFSNLDDSDNNRKFLRWICRNSEQCGGLGDRLYGIVMAFYIALLTNRTLLFDGWSQQQQQPQSSGQWQEPISSFLQPALMPILFLEDNNIVWKDNHNGHSGMFQQRVKIVDQRNHPVLLEPCRALDSSVKVIELQNNIMTHEDVLRNSSCFRQYCQRFGGSCPQEQRSLFHIGFWSLFRFTEQVKAQADRLRRLAGLSSDNSSRPYIAMHIRTGQGETWDDPPRHNGDANLKQFFDCAMALQHSLQMRCSNHNHNHNTSPPAPTPPLIYVAADNVYAKKRIQSWEDDSTAKTIQAVKEGDMEILHVGKSRAAEFRNYDLAYRHVWAELKVLIDSTCLVMSRSKFSYLALELSPQQPRCAVLFDQCGYAEVQTAIRSLNLTTTCP